MEICACLPLSMEGKDWSAHCIYTYAMHGCRGPLPGILSIYICIDTIADAISYYTLLYNFNAIVQFFIHKKN